MTTPIPGRPPGGHDIAGEVDLRLATLEHLSVAEHVAVYDRVHKLLQDALATLDEV